MSNKGDKKSGNTKTKDPRVKYSHLLVDPVSDRCVCTICGKSLKALQYFRRHVCVPRNKGSELVLEREKNYCCHQCGRLFFSLSGFKLHQTKHDLRVDADTCYGNDRQFMDERRFNNRRQLKHCKPELLRYHCLMCGFGTLNLQYLKSHLKCHLGTRPYACHICQKTFEWKGYLQDHLKTVHQNICSYSCETCEKQFKRKSSLNEHNKIEHTGEKPYSCSQCSRAFVRAKSLRDHISSHVPAKKPKKQYSCHLCNNRPFLDKTCWTVHMMSAHSDEKPYICHVCGKSFKLKNGLRAHSQTHSDERPYDCELCDSAFKFKKDLRKHQERHKSCKDYLCTICGKGFVTRNDVYLHQKVHDPSKQHRIYKPGKYKVSEGELITARTRKNLLSLKKQEPISFDTEIHFEKDSNGKECHKNTHRMYTDPPRKFPCLTVENESLSKQSLAFETFLDASNDSHEFDGYNALENASAADSPLEKYLGNSCAGTPDSSHLTAMSSCQELKTHEGWNSELLLEDYDWLDDASPQHDVVVEGVPTAEHVQGKLDSVPCSPVQDGAIQNVEDFQSFTSSVQEIADVERSEVHEHIVNGHVVDESMLDNHEVVDSVSDGDDQDGGVDGSNENIDENNEDENINGNDEDEKIVGYDEYEKIVGYGEAETIDHDVDKSIHDNHDMIHDNHDMIHDNHDMIHDNHDMIHDNHVMTENITDDHDEGESINICDDSENIDDSDEDGILDFNDENKNAIDGDEVKEDENVIFSDSDVDLQSLNEYLNEELNTCQSLTELKIDGFNNSVHSTSYGSSHTEDVQESSSNLEDSNSSVEDSNTAGHIQGLKKQSVALEIGSKHALENSDLGQFDSIFTPRNFETGFHEDSPTEFLSSDFREILRTEDFALTGVSSKESGRRQEKQLLIDFQMTSCDMFNDASDILEDNNVLDARSVRCRTPENDNSNNAVSFLRDIPISERKTEDEEDAEEGNKEEVKEDDVEPIDLAQGKHRSRIRVLEVVSEPHDELAHGIMRPKKQRKLAGSHLESPSCAVQLNIRGEWKHVQQFRSIDGKKFWCEDCGRSYTTQSNLNTHEAACHREDSKKFVCHLCGHSCNNKQNFRYHLVHHSSAKPYKCDMCQKCFKTRGAVRIHLNRHLPSKMVYKCDQCSQCYNHFNSLKAHKQTHILHAPFFICSICGKRLSDKSNLTAHTKRHLVPKKYPCLVCGKELSSVHSLHSHQGRACQKYQLKQLRVKEKTEKQVARLRAREDRKIIQEKKREMRKRRFFFCPLCVKQFEVPWKLLVHMTVHSCSRPFLCDVCGKTFKRASAIRIHKKISHSQKEG